MSEVPGRVSEVPAASSADDETGFQEARGSGRNWTSEPGRLFALTDGVFAIAMTLLALDVKINPAGTLPTATAFAHGRSDLFREYGVFFLAFFVIGQFWQANHEMLRRLERVDRAVLGKILPFLAGICSIPVAATLLTDYASVLPALALAAGLLAVTDLLHTRVFWYVSAPSRGLSAPMDPEDRFDGLLNSLWSPILFLLAIPLAALLMALGISGSFATLLWFLLRLDGAFVWTVRKILRRSRT